MHLTLTVKHLLGLLLLPLFIIVSCSDRSSTPPTQPLPAALSLASPARMTWVDANTLAVTDYNANRFCLVNAGSLETLTCFAAKGQPTGIAYVDYDGGRFYVGNKSVRSVDMFDRQGNFLGHVGGKTGLFGKVNDLAFDPFGQQLCVLDAATRTVHLYALNGLDPGISFGASVLDKPTALAVVPDTGEILVSDFGNPDSFFDSCPQIRVFDTNGNLASGKAIIGNLGGGGMLGSCDGTGQFSAPQGLFVDNDHNVFVVDALSSKVLLFNLETSRDVPIKSLGAKGTGEGELFYPLDVAVDVISKNVYVTDNRNARITVFAAGGTLP